jgi:hypothetical protein
MLLSFLALQELRDPVAATQLGTKQDLKQVIKASAREDRLFTASFQLLGPKDYRMGGSRQLVQV